MFIHQYTQSYWFETQILTLVYFNQFCVQTPERKINLVDVWLSFNTDSDIDVYMYSVFRADTEKKN